jgi:hypothetical protein
MWKCKDEPNNKQTLLLSRSVVWRIQLQQCLLLRITVKINLST